MPLVSNSKFNSSLIFSLILGKLSRPFNTPSINKPEREKLNLRIENRVDSMISDGLVEEVKKLYQYKDLNALNTVGYTEIFKHIDGDISLDEAIDLIKLNTRKYSKRQMTWFRKNKEIIWYSDGENYFKDILEELKF